MIHLVRHAHAGKRRHWHGDDRKRPLTGRGWRQSRQLAKRLSELPIPVIYTSPHVRCVETVLPLGDMLGMEVQTLKALREGQSPVGVLELLGDLPDHAVLCSHGDIIGGVIRRIAANGADLKGKGRLRDGRLIWQKASTWELTATKGGKVKTARYVLPPYPDKSVKRPW